jgi:Ras-related protein Rab-7A
MVGTTQMSLQIWDTAGQEKFNAIGLPFYRGANACGLVFDLSEQASFDKLTHWRDNFIDNNAPQDAESFPFVLIGNKAD